MNRLPLKQGFMFMGLILGKTKCQRTKGRCKADIQSGDICVRSIWMWGYHHHIVRRDVHQKTGERVERGLGQRLPQEEVVFRGINGKDLVLGGAFCFRVNLAGVSIYTITVIHGCGLDN